MGRVVTEKPRSGSGNPSAKARYYGEMVDGEYYGPMKLPSSMNKAEGLLGNKIGEKSFTDVLGPIRGYLRKQVGRPWDDVFSEVSRVLGSGSYPVRHVLHDHLLRDVCTNFIYSDDGKTYDASQRYGGYRFEVDGFYVDPDTGILCWKKRRPYRWRLDENLKSREQWKEIRPGVGYACVKGIWYYVERAPLIASLANNGTVISSVVIVIDGSDGSSVGCKVKRQLNKNELREHIYIKRVA